ncbi:MAG: nucleotide exchange factor GrpE [Proteobacteria bacterium]|nr:MAG: nucleotide exchange factor GrpE [Pseudomonadota bacterium]
MSEDLKKEEVCEDCENQEQTLDEEETSQEQDESGVSIEDLQTQIAQLKDENLREHADFENIKKRLEKEKYQAISYAHEQFARDLLPIIDALENALVGNAKQEANSDEVVKKYKEGIELTIEQFHKCFEKHQVKPVSCEGEFDPNVHEAIMKVDSKEVKSGHIVQTLQKGYTIKDRVLRPAMVSIAK